MRKVLRRTFLLLLVSALVLGAMAAYVRLTQHRPDPQAPLELRVTQDLIWPWQETELRLSYSGKEGVEVVSQPPPVADLVFLLDTSGSMDDADLATAKMELLNFPRDLGQNNELAVVEFASQANLIVPFSRDYERLRTTLAAMPRTAGGGISFLVGLREALRVLQGRPPATVVMLSDGGASESASELRSFYEREWQPARHKLFMVGVGTGGVDPTSFLQLTDDPAHYIVRGLDTGAIGEMFAEVRERMGNVLGRQGELQLPLAEPLWERRPPPAPAEAGLQVLSGPSGPDDMYALGTLFQRPYEWSVPLAPALGGILTTLADPVILSYRGANNERRELQADGAPKVLAVTPVLLFWLLLPALLYLLADLLAWLLRPAAKPVALRPPVSVVGYQPPPALAQRFPPEAQRVRWAPSLVLGLGGAGRQVLTHLRQIIDDTLDEPATRPVLLALDVARDEVKPPDEMKVLSPEAAVPGCLTALNDDQIFMLPEDVCRLQAFEDVQRRLGEPAAGLDLEACRNQSVEALRLNSGTHGDAALARLALLNDFARGAESALLQRLQAALAHWRQVDPDRRQRQIFIVANVQGGVGSGWLSDLLILLRRLVRTDEEQGAAVEIGVLLLGNEVPRRERQVPLEAPTLFAELERLAGAGRQPFRHWLSATPGAAAGLLDGLVERRPQDAVFVLPAGSRDDRKRRWYPAAADALVLFLEWRRRVEFTQALQGLQAVENRRRAVEGRELYTQVGVHNAVFPRSFFRVLLADRLLAALAGAQILFPGLELADGGEPQLRERTLEPAQLLATRKPDGEEPPFALALRDAAAGDRSTLDALEPDAASLRPAVQHLQRLLLENANRLLSEKPRRWGLAALLQAGRHLTQNFQDLDPAAVGDLTSACRGLADQAAVWIEAFWGNAVLKALDAQSVPAAGAGREGFMAERSRIRANTLKALQEWCQGDSRLLVGPLADADLTDAAGCRQRLDEHLREEFLKTWLDTEEDTGGDPVERLATRCYWEVAMPGPQSDEPVGISLILQGTALRRYGGTPADLQRFNGDVFQEVTNVLDSVGDFHILKLLQRRLPAGDAAGFITRLKGGLRGERSHLLLALPVVPGTYGSEVQALRRGLQHAFEHETVGAADLVYTCNDSDRYRIALMQLLPLLTAAPQRVPLQKPLHIYERRWRDYANRLARVLNVQTVQWPAVAGIALQDWQHSRNPEQRLREFARLYRAGQVTRWELDGLWHLYDGKAWQRLTFTPEQTLAEAAARFVTRPALTATVAAPDERPSAIAEASDDFVALLEWLTRTETAGGVT